jgi:hypothetical protein
MRKYQAQWQRQGNDSNWIYNDVQMQHDLFRHRIGTHPSLHVLLASIPVVHEGSIPADASTGRISMLETDAVLVAAQDLHILNAIKMVSPNFAMLALNPSAASNNRFIDGDIVAMWNGNAGTGTLTVHVFITTLEHQQLASITPTVMSKFFGTWFSIYPLPLSQVCGLL